MTRTLELAETILRPYQAVLEDRMQRAPGSLLLGSPTGSGKTTLLVSHLARNVGSRYSHALLAVPQEQIEAGFARMQPMLIKRTGELAAEVAIEVPEGFIVRARTSRAGSRAQILRYFDDPAPGYVLATTHAALAGLTAEDWARLPEDLSRMAFVVDECHHATVDRHATKLSDVVYRWELRGGRLIFATATAGRADGRLVKRAGMTVITRSLPQHMAEGYAPRTLESELVLVDGPESNPDLIESELGPTAADPVVAKALVDAWLRDGKPKTTVRLPPRRGGSEPLVREILRAFRAAGARVLDATGETEARKKAFIEAITDDRERSFATSTLDVIVGIGRVTEGTDWPMCAAVYSIGIPSSLPFLGQLIGRALRKKGLDYRADYRERARIVLFVRSDPGRTLDELSLDHSRHVALVSVFLADCELGAEWVVVRQVQRGIEQALGAAEESDRADDTCNEASEPVEPALRGEVTLALAAANDTLAVELARDPTVAEVVARVQAERRDLPAEAIERIAVECLAASGGETGRAVLEAIERGISTKLANPRFDPQIRDEMRAVFTEIVQQFRGETLSRSPTLVAVRRQIHKLSGADLLKLAKRLRDASRPPLTEALIVEWADEEIQATGAWPKGNGGGVHGHPGEVWKDINYCLWAGNRGLSGGKTLRQLLLEHRGVETGPADLDLDEDVRPILATFHETHGRYPDRDDGDVSGYPDLTFAALEQALHKGHRGLPGGWTLALAAKKFFGRPRRRDRKRVTLKLIRKRGKEHFKEHGRWPNRDSGQVKGEPESVTWAVWEGIVQHGIGGVPKKSSLRAVFTPGRQHVTVRSSRLAKQRTLKNVTTWMKKFERTTGDFPDDCSGSIGLEGTGETWDRLNRWLLKRKSSLVKLASTLGKRNKNRPPNVTPQWLRARVREHIKANGAKPERRTGVVAGHPGERWENLHSVMVRGGRGLASLKGTTLAQFVERYCVNKEPLPGESRQTPKNGRHG